LIEQIKDITYQPDEIPDEMQVDDEDARKLQKDVNGAIKDNLAKGAAVPTQQEIEQILVQRRRQQVSVNNSIYNQGKSLMLILSIIQPVTGQICIAGYRRK
jgi:hypothetical protein